MNFAGSPQNRGNPGQTGGSGMATAGRSAMSGRTGAGASMGGKREKLLMWLNGCVDPSREHALDRLEIVHMSNGEEHIIGRWDASPESDTAKLASDVLKYASDDAEGHPSGMMQHYYLYAYFGGAEVWEMRHAMYFGNGRQQVQNGYGGGFEMMNSSEGPNPTGMIAQAQRFTEFFAQGMVAMSGENREILKEELDRLRQDLNDSRTENRALRAEMAQNRKEEIEEEQRRFRRKLMDDAMKEAMQLLKVMAPYLVNYFAGGPIMPQDTTPILESLSGVFESFDDQKVAAIAQILGPVNMVPIMELYKSFRERQMKRQGVVEKKNEASGSTAASPENTSPTAGGPGPGVDNPRPPEAGLPTMESLRSAIEAITQEKIPQLVPILGPEMLLPMMEMHRAYKSGDIKVVLEKLLGIFEAVDDAKFSQIVAVLGAVPSMPLIQLYKAFQEKKREAAPVVTGVVETPTPMPPTVANSPFTGFPFQGAGR